MRIFNLAGLKPHTAEEVDLTRMSRKDPEPPARTPDERKKSSKIGKVSFDDYHAMWSGIATTKPVLSSNNPLSEVLKADSNLQATHFGLPQQELHEEIHKQLTEHNAIMYGNFDTGRDGRDLTELKTTRIQLLKQIYLPKQQGMVCASVFRVKTISLHSLRRHGKIKYWEGKECGSENSFCQGNRRAEWCKLRG